MKSLKPALSNPPTVVKGAPQALITPTTQASDVAAPQADVVELASAQAAKLAAQTRERRTAAAQAITLAALTHVKVSEDLGQPPYGAVKEPMSRLSSYDFHAAFAAVVEIPAEALAILKEDVAGVREEISKQLAAHGLEVLTITGLEFPQFGASLVFTDTTKRDEFLATPEWQHEAHTGKRGVVVHGVVSAAIPIFGWVVMHPEDMRDEWHYFSRGHAIIDSHRGDY